MRGQRPEDIWAQHRGDHRAEPATGLAADGPNDQGYEATIGERMARRAAARAAAQSSGRTPRTKIPSPEVRPRAGDSLMKTREASRKKLADTEKRDAGADRVIEGSSSD